MGSNIQHYIKQIDSGIEFETNNNNNIISISMNSENRKLSFKVGKLELLFDNKNKEIYLNNNNTAITMSENSIRMKANTITLDASNIVNIQSKKTELSAKEQCDISSSGAVNVNAVNINLG